jgi:hypothetical protein
MPATPLKSFLPAGLLLLAALGALAVLSARPAADARQVAAVYPPWLSFAERMAAVDAAGGIALSEGAWSGVVIVDLPSADARAELRRAGAWLLLDPRGVAGCAVPGWTRADTL